MIAFVHQYINYKCLADQLPAIDWKRMLLCLVAMILVIITTFAQGNIILIKTNNTNRLMNQQTSGNYSFKYKTVPMPCLQPHCEIQCIDIYGNGAKDGIIDSRSLSKTQQQHLMIDMGNDPLVNELISSIPPPKICPNPQQSGVPSTVYSNTTVKFYPLVFGFVDQYLLQIIPREVFLDNKLYKMDQICLPKKSMDFNKLIPGRKETYRFKFENEIDYRRMYGTAYFALTMKKGGWDCNRHYEIISTGTTPYFDDLDQAGNYTLSHLPKSLLYDAQRLAGINRKNLTIDHRLFNVDDYNLILHRLLYYAKYRLTTIKLVEYILKVIKYPLEATQKHSILYISHNGIDYMKEYMLHGFTRIFEENLHAFQPPKYLYDYPAFKMWNSDETKAYYQNSLYGFGYGYKLILKNYVHLYERDTKELPTAAVVQNKIANRSYSLIVFGSILRENSLLSFVTQYYDKSKIVLIDGEDVQRDTRRSEYAKLAYYFLREIPEDCHQFT